MLKPSISICWAIQTMSGALLGIFDTHSAAVEHIEQCQSRPTDFPTWLSDLRIKRVEVSI